MYKFLLPALAVLFSVPFLTAQCVQFNCPAPTDTICDLASNYVQFWNENYWWDPLNESHDLAETPTDLQFYIKDSCGGATLSYVLLLDLDHDGTLETRISSDSIQQPGTVPFGNTTTPGGNLRVFDQRPVTDSLKYIFSLQQTLAGDTLTGQVRWNTLQTPDGYIDPRLPLGKHRIIWYIRNGASLDSCGQDFLIRDCKKPFITCSNTFSVNLMPTCMIQLWASDFFLFVHDNVTPSTMPPIAIVRSGQSTGAFPTNPDGSPQTSIIFTSNDFGTQAVQVWTKDQAGNTEYCETYVIIQDNNGNCGMTPPGLLQVCVYTGTQQNSPVDELSVELDITSPGIPPFSVSGALINGCFQYPGTLPPGSTITVKPFKNTNHINGISTYDLVLISKHILNTLPLDSPYKMIAADANHNDRITSFDIVEFKKLILGIYTELPDNTSWRFVDKAFVFPNPQNPWQTVFPESILINSIQNQVNVHFVAIKIGDLNGNAVANGATSAYLETRNTTPLTLPDIALKAGETVEIPLQMSEAAQWVSLQVSLEFDSQNLDIETVTSNALPDFAETAWAKPQPGRLNLSWFSVKPQTLLPAENLVTLRVHARTDLRLRDAVVLNNESLRAEAYSDQGVAQNLSLQFREQPATATTTTIFPAQPNPTTAGTLIPLRLQSAEKVLLEVFNVSGKLIFQQAKQLDAGAQMLEIQTAVLKTTGVYTWRVQAGAVLQTGRIVRQ